MSESFSVNESWCPVHGIGARQRRTSVVAGQADLSWWECPQCNVAGTHPMFSAAGAIPFGSVPLGPPIRLYTQADVDALNARLRDLECRPLVLLAKREAHADALTDAQVCDRAEATRRAERRYPLPAEVRNA